jgi:hypothetical protein
MKRLYTNPHAARQAFLVDAYDRGIRAAVATLKDEPHRYGDVHSWSRWRHGDADVQISRVYATLFVDRRRAVEMAVARKLRFADAIEEAALRISELEKPMAKAQAAYTDLCKLGPAIERAEAKLLDEARHVFRNPAEAVAALKRRSQEQSYWKTEQELKEAPEKFGLLKPDQDGLVGWVKETTQNLVGSDAYGSARKSADQLSRTYWDFARLGDPPSQAALEQAKLKVEAAERAVKDAWEARHALPRESPMGLVQEAAKDLKRIAGTPSAAQVKKRLAVMLPVPVLPLLQKAIKMVGELAEGPERERGGPEL